MSSITSKDLLALIVGVWLFYCVAQGIKRLYFHPLSKFPGPKLSALTLWYEFYYDVIRRGSLIWKLEGMHNEYGPIVRINPHELHIRDPNYLDEIYAPGSKRRDKYDWWVKLGAADLSGFSTVNHDLHRLRRGALNPFFSKRSVVQLEPVIKAKVEKLSKRFDSIAEKREIVRLDVAFLALTMDIICDYSFANDRRYLDQDDFGLEWKGTIITASEGTIFARHLPWLFPLTKSLPVSVGKRLNPAVGNLLSWQADVKAQVESILNHRDLRTDVSQRTIFHTLRDSDLPSRERTLDRLSDEGRALTGAESETTAAALTRTLFYLIENPEKLLRLRAELMSVMPEPLNLPAWSALEQLPYLMCSHSAVVHKGLRLSYSLTTRLPRVAHEPLTYKEWTIPAGTPVSQTMTFVLHNPTLFPSPASFQPERWLAQPAEGTPRLDKYNVVFDRGSRQCLGMNLAYAEMYLTLAMVVARFDFELYETSLKDVQLKHDFLVAFPDLSSKGVRARIKRVERAAG